MKQVFQHGPLSRMENNAFPLSPHKIYLMIATVHSDQKQF